MKGTPLITLGYTLLVAEDCVLRPISWRRHHHLRYGGYTHGRGLGGIIGHDISYLLYPPIRALFSETLIFLSFTDGRVILEQALTTAMTLSLYILVLEQPIGEMDPAGRPCY